ncbi:MAG: helix-turn-helix transcriptional regulator [Syntrophaceae bacterium]
MNLQEYREFKSISVKKASEELGICRQHIYDIEKRKAFPSRKLSKKISEWSGGLVTQGELLFPDLSKLIKDNLVKLNNWKEKGGEIKSANSIFKGNRLGLEEDGLCESLSRSTSKKTI